MIAFRVYPVRGDKRHYRVIVFDSPRQMYGYSEVSVAQRTSRIPGTGRFDYDGIACYRDRIVFGQRLDSRGEIHLHQGRLGPEIVAHEMTHAAHYFLKNDCHMRPGSRRWDEAMARAVGELCRQFWICYHRKLKS